MCHLCGKKNSLQGKPKKRKCYESALTETKNTIIYTRTMETYQYLKAEETWRNSKEREIQSNRKQIESRRKD